MDGVWWVILDSLNYYFFVRLPKKLAGRKDNGTHLAKINLQLLCAKKMKEKEISAGDFNFSFCQPNFWKLNLAITIQETINFEIIKKIWIFARRSKQNLPCIRILLKRKKIISICIQIILFLSVLLWEWKILEFRQHDTYESFPEFKNSWVRTNAQLHKKILENLYIHGVSVCLTV